MIGHEQLAFVGIDDPDNRRTRLEIIANALEHVAGFVLVATGQPDH